MPVKAIPSSGRCRKKIQFPNRSRAVKVKDEKAVFKNKTTCLRVFFSLLVSMVMHQKG